MFPCSMDLRSCAREADRLFQLSVSGVTTSLSMTKSATITIAKTARRRWRLSIFNSIAPLEVKGELQRRIAADLIHPQVTDVFRAAQAINRRQQRSIISRSPDATDRRAVANLDDLGR